jgi:hypothetical protein
MSVRLWQFALCFRFVSCLIRVCHGGHSVSSRISSVVGYPRAPRPCNLDPDTSRSILQANNRTWTASPIQSQSIQIQNKNDHVCPPAKQVLYTAACKDTHCSPLVTLFPSPELPINDTCTVSVSNKDEDTSQTVQCNALRSPPARSTPGTC